MSALAPRPASCKYDRSGDSQEIRPIISPIHQLPTELLVKIFVHCIPPNVIFIYSSHPPLLLARICSHWRTVALGTPCLWRYIPNSSFVKSPGKWERQASLAKLFLSRSAECPLSIRVSLCCLTSTNDHPVLDALILHAHRWEDVSLCIQVSWCRFLEPLVGKLSQLRKLDFHRVNYDAQLRPIRCFQIAPKLREVDISLDHRSLFLPWSQLTRCTLSYLKASSCSEIMRLASGLIHCMLNHCPPDSVVPHHPIDSQLVSLHVQETHGGEEISIFPYVSLPALRDLSIISLVGVDWHQSHFINFFLRSGCRVERFALSGTNIASEEFLSLLEEMPSLIELQILWIDASYSQHLPQPILHDDLLKRLTYEETSSDGLSLLLPKLRSIMLCGPLPFDDHLLVEMVHSRLRQSPPAVAGLVYVGLRYHREFDAPVLRQLKDLEGLKLSVRRVHIERCESYEQWDGFTFHVSILICLLFLPAHSLLQNSR